MAKYEPLVKEYRGSLTDNVHCGYICVVDEKSRIVCHAGDPDEYVYYRSSAKPIQALDTVALGLDKKYGITEEESVLFASSHAAEPFHVAALCSVMEKTGLSEELLVMSPAAPVNASANEERIRGGLPLRRIYHNCAGMHMSLMLIQRELGGNVRDYWKPDSPAGIRSQKTVSVFSELTESEIAAGTDGCGVPVFAVSMKNAAAAFKNLACVDTVGDETLSSAAARYLPRLNKYSRMIRGTGFLCSLINRDPNIIAKGGGAGIYAIGLKKERTGISLKLADGTENTWPLIIAEIFRQIGYHQPDTKKTLEQLHDGILYNDSRVPVGHFETVFKLSGAL